MGTLISFCLCSFLVSHFAAEWHCHLGPWNVPLSKYCAMNLNLKVFKNFISSRVQAEVEFSMKEKEISLWGRKFYILETMKHGNVDYFYSKLFASLGIVAKALIKKEDATQWKKTLISRNSQESQITSRSSVLSHPTLRTNSKPKSCNKERVRLKKIPFHSRFSLLYFKPLCKTLLFAFLFMLSSFPPSLCTSMEEAKLHWCPSQCSCETFFLPTVSGVQNAWPSLLTSSLLSEALLVSLRNPTTFEALIASILTTQPAKEEAMGDETFKDSEGKNGTQGDLGPQGRDILPSSAPRTDSLISPGEIFVDCSNGALENSSFFNFAQQTEELQKIVKL